jgi:large subunit ribosomal protein L9
MKVLLLKNVPKVGKKDEILEVPDGYARNALFPGRAAVQATSEVIAKHAKELKRREDTANFEHAMLEKLYKELAQKTFFISAPHNDKGVLFKKITLNEILDAIESQEKCTLDRTDLMLETNGDIKEIGSYTLRSKYFPEQTISVTVR